MVIIWNIATNNQGRQGFASFGCTAGLLWSCVKLPKIFLIPSMIKISKNTITNTVNFYFRDHTCTCIAYQHRSAVSTSAYAHNFLTYEDRNYHTISLWLTLKNVTAWRTHKNTQLLIKYLREFPAWLKNLTIRLYTFIDTEYMYISVLSWCILHHCHLSKEITAYLILMK